MANLLVQAKALVRGPKSSRWFVHWDAYRDYSVDSEVAIPLHALLVGGATIVGIKVSVVTPRAWGVRASPGSGLRCEVVFGGPDLQSLVSLGRRTLLVSYAPLEGWTEVGQ